MNSDYRNEEDPVSDEHLNDEAKHPGDRNKKKRLFLIIASAAAMLLAGYLVMEHVLSETDAESRYSPKMQKYIEVIDYDQNFMLAAQHDLLQELHVSDTSGEYELAVGGIIADEEKAVILYSVSGPDLKEHQDATDAIELIIDEDAPHSIGYGHTSLNEDETIIYQSIQLNMEHGELLPNELKLEMNINEQPLEVTFPVDHSQFAGMREHMDINKTIVIDNQTLTFHDMEITPLQTMIRMETDTENTKNINHLNGFRLTDNKGNHWAEISNGTNGSGDISSGSYIAYMDSIYFDKPDHLSIMLDGVSLSDKNLEFVLNTDTLEMVEAPDDRLKIAEIDRNQGYVYIQLEYNDPEESFNKPPYRVLRLLKEDSVFTDAAGIKYKITGSPQSAFSFGDNRTTLLYMVNIPNEDYEQPLTFEINEYPGKVDQKIEIPVY